MCINEGMADSRLTAAISHWAPRFTAGGVDPGDFSRITSTLTSWDDWCAAWCRAAAEHGALGTVALAEGRTRSAGGHLAQAAVYYHFAKFLFVQDMGQLRAAHQAAVRLRDQVPGPAELLLLDDGNHGCANVIYRHRPYSADWMARQLTG